MSTPGTTRSRDELSKKMPDAFGVFFEGRNPYESQALVMPEVVQGKNVLFAAPTASGKTEAAVTPLYQRHISFARRGLSTVYVAPTKALVNDLYERLLGYLASHEAGLVARYTGDRHEFSDPRGVFCLLCTPEALDSLQLRRPHALAGVRAVIIDEIHLLHGQPRGQQLRHVIARLAKAAVPPRVARDSFQLVGMTATLDDMSSVAATWLGPNAKVVSHGTAREIDLTLVDVAGTADRGRERARVLAEWLARTGTAKVLVFSNSRNGAHELAAHLHRELAGQRWPVHLHYGSVAASERERVEEAMRKEPYGVCVATTTLEIGIDIGSIDAVVLSEPPWSVSGFLQRIGRGNRRSGTCRVVAFRSSDDEERQIRAIVECGRRGELDDVHEYDRPSVRFQQILSLAWRATREDRALSTPALCEEADDVAHVTAVRDMLETGCLRDVRGALVPGDLYMDEADAGRVHTVIAGKPGGVVIDGRTGEAAIRDVDESVSGGALFHGGRLRRVVAAPGGGVFLGEDESRVPTLGRIRGSGAGVPLSRTIVWSMGRQRGHDPARWQISEGSVTTWGGGQFNNLLAALFARQAMGAQFRATPETVEGPIHRLEFSLDAVREWANLAQLRNDLPAEVVERFANASRYLGQLSPRLALVEKRASVPWPPFLRWLGRIEGIDRARL
jgi:ATP-dependent Lhr-like helicase